MPDIPQKSPEKVTIGSLIRDILRGLPDFDSEKIDFNANILEKKAETEGLGKADRELIGNERERVRKVIAGKIIPIAKLWIKKPGKS